VAPAEATTREAQQHFRRGIELYKEGDHAGALVEFKRSYDLSLNYRVLYNLGQTEYQLQRYAEALDALETYLAKGGADLPAARRAAVEADVRQLAGHVGWVAVKVNVDGAQILVDGEPAGISPLPAALRLSIGRRRISVSWVGMASQDRWLDLAAGDHAEVAFDLPAPAVAASAPADATPAPPPPSAPIHEATAAPVPPPATPATAAARTAAASGGPPLWLLWGATGALAGATVVAGVLTVSAKNDLDAQMNTFPGDAAAIDAARSRGRAWGLTADVLGGAAVLGGATALYFTLSSRGGRPPASARALEWTLGPANAGLRGRF
jgi:hypothetical protein